MQRQEIKRKAKRVHPINHSPPPIHVVTLSTDKNSALENWEYSAKSLGYTYKILGLGMKWGGWSFRTKQYIIYIKTLPDDALILVVDGNDILFVRGPDALWEGFKRINQPLIFGGEVSCCTGKYAHSLSNPKNPIGNRKKAIEEIQRRLPPTRYCFPNAGCILGWKENVLNALETVKEENDDQAGHLEQYLKNPNYLSIDWGHDIVGNVNKVGVLWCVDCSFLDDLETHELKYYDKVDNQKDKIVITNCMYQNNITRGIPCILHFAGKNMHGYNVMGAHLYGSKFKPVHMSYNTDTIGKNALLGIASAWK